MVSKSSGKKDMALETSFHNFIMKQKRWGETAGEDVLRRLLNYKPRRKKK